MSVVSLPPLPEGFNPLPPPPKLGFKNALALTREAIEVVATVSDGDADVQTMSEISDGQHAEAVEAEEAGDKPKDKKVQNVLALKSAAHKAIRTVIAMKKKNYTLLLDGYQLTIRKIGKGETATPAAE